ncbi:MAG TPA: phosphoglycerate mutase family protein [Chthoniobacterales bacterium]|nr:phosphoglycerate mutase family protein [Chthoniobacterales bacterium]
MTRLPVLAALLFSALSPLDAQVTVYLVRHAEKAQDGDSKDPDLSATGRARAETLAQVVKDVGVTAIFATELKRTQQTAAPLAKLTGVPLTIVPPKNTAALVAKLRQAVGCALVVGHSNTLPEIIRALGVNEPVTIADEEYDTIFVVKTEMRPPEFMRLRYADKAE